jgi:hypothetical protein
MAELFYGFVWFLGAKNGLLCSAQCQAFWLEFTDKRITSARS